MACTVATTGPAIWPYSFTLLTSLRRKKLETLHWSLSSDDFLFFIILWIIESFVSHCDRTGILSLLWLCSSVLRVKLLFLKRNPLELLDLRWNSVRSSNHVLENLCVVKHSRCYMHWRRSITGVISLISVRPCCTSTYRATSYPAECKGELDLVLDLPLVGVISAGIGLSGLNRARLPILARLFN